MGNQVEMVFWDVQHGHATYVKSPNDRHIVIDLGTGQYSKNNLIFSPLKHLRYNYGVIQLDYVIITHPHLDHMDDIMQFDNLNPKVLWRPTLISNQEVMKGVRQNDWEKFNKYCDINNRYNTSISTDDYNNTEDPNNWGGMQITGYNAVNCDHDNFNNFSHDGRGRFSASGSHGFLFKRLLHQDAARVFRRGVCPRTERGGRGASRSLPH